MDSFFENPANVIISTQFNLKKCDFLVKRSKDKHGTKNSFYFKSKVATRPMARLRPFCLLVCLKAWFVLRV